MPRIEVQPEPKNPPNRLRELRIASDMRRATIAHHVGRDTMTLYRYEKREQAIPDDIKAKLAELFGVSIPWLMCWEDQTNGSEAAA